MGGLIATAVCRIHLHVIGRVALAEATLLGAQFTIASLLILLALAQYARIKPKNRDANCQIRWKLVAIESILYLDAPEHLLHDVIIKSNSLLAALRQTCFIATSLLGYAAERLREPSASRIH